MTMLLSTALPIFAAETETLPPSTENAPIEDASEVKKEADLDVFARNIEINDNVYIQYAVPFDGREDVKMLFWTEGQTEYTVENADYVVKPDSVQNVLGKTANIFKFKDFQDEQMTDVIYARAYIVKEDGTYKYGAVNKYSVLQYAYNILEYEEVSDEIEKILGDLLDRGARAQERTGYKLDDLANAPHSFVQLVDELLPDGFAEYLIPSTTQVVGRDRYMITTAGISIYIELTIIITGYRIVGDYMYYFDGENGAKKNDTYEGYNFDRRGHIIADLEFIIIDNNTYYFVDQKIVRGYYVIEMYLYFFGADGAMKFDTTVDGNEIDSEGRVTGSNIYIDTGDNVYYIVDSVVICIYIYIDGVIYLDFDGELIPTVDYSNTVSGSDGVSGALEGVECIARIESLNITITVYTDENGSFVFPILPKVEIIFIFIIEGYSSGEINVDLSGNDGSEALSPVVLDKLGTSSLTGKITIADTDTNFGNNMSLAGATVTIERASGVGSFVLTTVSDAYGNYKFEGLATGVYKITVIINGYITVTQIVNIITENSNIQNSVIEAVPDTGDTTGSASGVITDARTGLAVVGVKVVIRLGLNNTTGEIIKTLTTDAYGKFNAEGLLPGNYTAQVVDDRVLDNEDLRFGSIVIAIKVLGGFTISNQNGTSSNNVGLDIDGMRVVLTWGSTPSDLDSHMEADTNNGYCHISYANKDELDINLDVDDTSSYGPETTTVSTIYEGTYRFYIFNYSRDSLTGLSNSGAKVEIYFGSNIPTYTLYVPQGSGYYWNVFTYDSTTGTFTIDNTIS